MQQYRAQQKGRQKKLDGKYKCSITYGEQAVVSTITAE
jgi:hypothetical protein